MRRLDDLDVGDVAGDRRPVRLGPGAPGRTCVVEVERGRPGRSRPGAGRPRRRARWRARRRRRPCRAAGRCPPRPGPTGPRPTPRMSARSLARSWPGPVQPGRAAAQQPAVDQVVGHLGRRPAPNSGQVVVAQRGSSAAAAHRCGREHVRVAGVEHGRLDRLAEQRLGVVDEVGVQRVVAGDQHRQGALPGPAGPAGLLPQRRPGAGPAGEQHRVQPGDVDAELERVGRRRRRAAGRTAGRPPAPGAPRAGSRPGRRRPGRPARGRPRRAAAGRSDDTVSAPRRDRTKASVRTPSATRSASRSAASAVAVRRTGASCSPASSVSGGSQSANSSSPRGEPSSVTGDDLAARPAGRRTPPGRRRSPRRARTPGRRRSARRPAAAGAAPRATCEPNTPR